MRHLTALRPLMLGYRLLATELAVVGAYGFLGWPVLRWTAAALLLAAAWLLLGPPSIPDPTK